MTNLNIPQITIIDHTGKGNNDPLYAAKLLAYTKNTRLQMTPAGMEEFFKKSENEILKELEYMSNTIPSSWEFVDVTFSIERVSRACAQQITRTRTASYAMQSQRVTDMSTASYHIPESVRYKANYKFMIERAISDYNRTIFNGESLEDARGLLPMNIHCNLIAKYNLRSLVDLLRARKSPYRVQGEYQSVAQQMQTEVEKIWPWTKAFFVPKDDKAISLIEDVAGKIENKELKMQLAKAADLLKK